MNLDPFIPQENAGWRRVFTIHRIQSWPYPPDINLSETLSPCYPSAHERKSHHTDPERFRYCGELHLVREMGLAQALGLGNAADLRRSGLRRMRDFSLPGWPRKPRQRSERGDF